MTTQESQPNSKRKSRFFYGYTITACSLLISVATLSAHNSFGVFFKPLVTQFEWSRAALSGALSVSLIVTGFLSIIMGGISDRIGPRPVTTVCALVTGAGYILMSQVSTIWEVYLFFGFLVGLGMSGTWIPLITTIARWFDRKRGLMTGIFATGVGIGPLLGPMVTSWLLSKYTWQTSYIIIGTLSLVVMLVASQFLKRDPAQMGLLPDGARQTAGPEPKPALEGFSLRQAVATPQYWLISVMFFCMGYWYFSILVHIVPYATDLGIAAVSAAGILAISGATTVVGNVLLGSLSDRKGIRPILILSIVLTVASLFWLFAAREVWALYLFAAVSGFAFGGFLTVESPLVAQHFGLRSHGLIFAVIVFGFTIGASSGPFLTGYIFDRTGSYQYDFIIYAALAVIALIIAIILRPGPRPNTAQPLRKGQTIRR